MFPPWKKPLNEVYISWTGSVYPIQLPIYNTAVEEPVPHPKPHIEFLVEFVPLPRLQNKVAATIPPPVVNDPPFGRKVLWFNTVLDAWIPPPPPPWNPILYITPPPSDDIIIWMWKRVL